jgi:hypothetical protein
VQERPCIQEGREDEHLVGLELEQPVVNAHVFPAAYVDIEFIEIMAVILGYFEALIILVARFISRYPCCSIGRNGACVGSACMDEPPFRNRAESA